MAVALRGWLLWNTEVAARDSIGFIRYALQFDGQARPPQIQTCADVIRNNHQHPGYPLTILAASIPIRHLLGETSRYAMQLSAPLPAGRLPSSLYSDVLPRKNPFDRGVGFWGALLFQSLPGSAHILSDGLSEALSCCSPHEPLLAALAVRANSRGRIALCGGFCGLTYLVRPEGGLVLAAIGLVLVGMKLAGGDLAGVKFGAWGSSLGLGEVAVGSPYVLITGHLTNKPSVHIMVGNYPEDPLKTNRRRSLDDKPAPSPIRTPRLAGR